jgi:uncharacterized protein (TIGR03083 family)
MPQLSPERYDAQIEASTAQIAALVGAGDLTMRIPTCPAWNLRQLASHVGRAHRWVAETTATRSTEMIPLRSVADGALPDDPARQVPWLTDGAQHMIAAVREAGDDRVWAFGTMAPASTWGRRMCHETVVHRIDAQLAAGQQPDLDPDVAIDAIDEWLTVLSAPLPGDPDPRSSALPEGRVLHIHTTDGASGTGEWLIRHQSGGVTVEPGHGKGDAAMTGPAALLLQVLLRRAPADDPALTVFGDPGLVTRWLAETPY